MNSFSSAWAELAEVVTETAPEPVTQELGYQSWTADNLCVESFHEETRYFTSRWDALCPYVDVNPARAGLAASIGEAAFNSGQQGVLAVVIRGDEDTGLPFNLQNYLDRLVTSGRAVHPRRRGLIPTSTPNLLTALGLDTSDWLATVCELPARFHLFVGAPHRLGAVAASRRCA